MTRPKTQPPGFIVGQNHLYVVGAADGPQKVGISSLPHQRLAYLQNGSPRDLFLHHCIAVDPAVARVRESQVHTLLSERHLRGEWFDITPAQAIQAMEDVIAAVARGDEPAWSKRPVWRGPVVHGGHKDGALVSLRPPPWMLIEINAYAAQRGIKRHPAILELIDLGLAAFGVTQVAGQVVITPKDQLSPKLQDILSRAQDTALRGDVQPKGSATTKAPLAQAEARAAHLASPAPRKRNWSLKGVQFGPSHPEPGSRLKGRGLHPKTK